MTGPWIAAFAALAVLFFVLAFFMLGLFTRIDHVIDRLDVAQPRHRHPQIVAGHGEELRELFRVDATPYALIFDGDAVVAAVGVPNSTDDLTELVRVALRQSRRDQTQPAASPVAAQGRQLT